MSTEEKLEQQAVPSQAAEKKHDKKPVVVYIMILFIVAFLLMALSFLMHQRTNPEALGELRNSVTAMQEVQAFQEKIIDLQEQMDELQEEVESLQSEVDNQQAHNEQLLSRLEAREKELEALAYFYTLQQQYLTKFVGVFGNNACCRFPCNTYTFCTPDPCKQRCQSRAA